MYHYQLMLPKDYELLGQQAQSYLSSMGYANSFNSPKRIKYFYPSDYTTIVKQLVNEPNSCKDFYQVLQQVGLPEQTYYHRISDKVTDVLKTALAENKVILLHRVDQGSYLSHSSSIADLKPTYQQSKKVILQPQYEPDDSWLIIHIVNNRQQPIQIYDSSCYELVVATNTSEDEIFLKHGDTFSLDSVLPKVNLYLGGLNHQIDHEQRGFKPLRVKTLAQSWLDGLYRLLDSGKSPFITEQDHALASQYNYNRLKDSSKIKSIDPNFMLRTNEVIGAFFWQLLRLLNSSYFFTPTQRIGDCSANESEGAIFEPSIMRSVIDALDQIKHCGSYYQKHNQSNSEALYSAVIDYLYSSITQDQMKGNFDYESKLEQVTQQYFAQERLDCIWQLFVDSIRVIKFLRQPGSIRQVETRKEYKLKTKQLDYQYIDLQSSRIRLDAQKLLQCVSQISERHLYHSDIKQAFIDEVTDFANDIVQQVENGTISYENGSQQLKLEEKSYLGQAYAWFMNGLSVFGGAGMIMAGFALCSTGLGCMIGAPLIAHGANSVYEGASGIYNGVANAVDGGDRSLNVEGPLRQAYQLAAIAIGFNKSVGTLVYDLVDLGISVRGKLKLVPKLNEFGNPKFKLFAYGRQDLERVYLQMSRYLLAAELLGDSLSLIQVKDDLKNVFVLDQDTQQVIMVINEPEEIINAKQIEDTCMPVILITGKDEVNLVDYEHCDRADGTSYHKYFDGHIKEKDEW